MNSNSDTFAIRSNATNVEKECKKFKKNISRITYYNYNKKSYYSRKYPKSRKKNPKN